jgi:hypothetical protein
MGQAAQHNCSFCPASCLVTRSAHEANWPTITAAIDSIQPLSTQSNRYLLNPAAIYSIQPLSTQSSRYLLNPAAIYSILPLSAQSSRYLLNPAAIYSIQPLCTQSGPPDDQSSPAGSSRPDDQTDRLHVPPHLPQTSSVNSCRPDFSSGLP